MSQVYNDAWYEKSRPQNSGKWVICLVRGSEYLEFATVDKSLTFDEAINEPSVRAMADRRGPNCTVAKLGGDCHWVRI